MINEPSPLPYATLRQQMVEKQIRERGVRDEALLAAMAEVPREWFVPAEYQQESYYDGPLPIPAGQTISQPYVVALMLRALRLAPTGRVLEVGSGSGYAAAILSRLVSEVYAIERHPVLVESAGRITHQLGYTNIHFRQGDGTLGWPEAAPFNAILVSAAGPYVPPALLKQLADSGRLIMPVGPSAEQQKLVLALCVSQGHYRHKNLGPVRFVPLVGAHGWLEDSFNNYL